MNKLKFILLFSGIFLSFVPFLYNSIWPFQSFAAPVEIKTGSILEKTFQPAHTTRYDIELAVTGTDQSNRAECLLTGQTSFSGPCQEKSQIEISWELFKNGALIESGTVVGEGANSWSQQNVSRLLGWADLEAGSEYTLKVNSFKNFPEISEFKPQISVSTPPSYYKDRFFYLSLTQLLGFLLIGASVLLEFYSRLFTGRRLRTGTSL